MYHSVLTEQTPDPFDLTATVRAHGWAALAPFHWDAETQTLSRVHCLSDGMVARLNMLQPNHNDAVTVAVNSPQPLDVDDAREIRQAVRRMLRLDEDLSEFHGVCQQMADWELRVSPGGGRLLRCPTLFEDVVCTLCTTNITWSGTKRMVRLLVEKLGQPCVGQPEWRAFPTPAAIAAAGVDFLRQEVGLGYRSAYLWELAQAVVDGTLDLPALDDPAHSTAEVRRALLQIKGVGHYAAATILMLLGRYEYLAIDTEMRAFVSKKYGEGAPPSDEQIRTLYAPWGRWQYLAYWFDAVAEEG